MGTILGKPGGYDTNPRSRCKRLATDQRDKRGGGNVVMEAVISVTCFKDGKVKTSVNNFFKKLKNT